jgi:hypothetical protein
VPRKIASSPYCLIAAVGVFTNSKMGNVFSFLDSFLKLFLKTADLLLNPVSLFNDRKTAPCREQPGLRLYDITDACLNYFKKNLCSLINPAALFNYRKTAPRREQPGLRLYDYN